MDWLNDDIISQVTFLLPGFVSAWVFYGLTAHPRRQPFERVIQAFILNGFSLASTWVEKPLLEWMGQFYSVGQWTQQVAISWSVLNAVVIGLVFTFCANNDLPHRILRKIELWGFRLTKRTTYPSEWNSTFDKNITDVVLHLRGGLRLMGYPVEYPDSADSGHFLLENCTWLSDANELIPCENVQVAVVPAKRVVLVEQLLPPKMDDGNLNPWENDKSSPANIGPKGHKQIANGQTRRRGSREKMKSKR